MARRWKKPGEHSRRAWVGTMLVLAAFGLTGVAALGSRSGWWPGPAALQVVPWAMALAGAGLLIAVLARFGRRASGKGLAIVAILLGAAYLATATNELLRVRRSPGLLDVSTDTVDPPAFARPLRADLHSGQMGSRRRPGFAMLTPDERWQAVHHEAYPGLTGLLVKADRPTALRSAEQAAQTLGWTIRRRSATGFEAEARTPLFGLVDEVAVRVRTRDGQSRIDVRSVRREGRRDRGQGIRNIHRLLARIADRQE